MSAFLENGYHGTGIKEVLDRVNVPKGSFYSYFASKEELGEAAIQYYAMYPRHSCAAALTGPLESDHALSNKACAHRSERGLLPYEVAPPGIEPGLS